MMNKIFWSLLIVSGLTLAPTAKAQTDLLFAGGRAKMVIAKEGWVSNIQVGSKTVIPQINLLGYKKLELKKDIRFMASPGSITGPSVKKDGSKVTASGSLHADNRKDDDDVVDFNIVYDAEKGDTVHIQCEVTYVTAAVWGRNFSSNVRVPFDSFKSGSITYCDTKGVSKTVPFLQDLIEKPIGAKVLFIEGDYGKVTIEADKGAVMVIHDARTWDGTGFDVRITKDVPWKDGFPKTAGEKAEWGYSITATRN